MNIQSGLFTAPSAGVYMFTAFGLGSPSTTVALNVNGVQISYAWAYANSKTYGMQQVLELKAGDQVSLFLMGGSILGNAKHTHFTGIQLSTLSAPPNGLAYFYALKNQPFATVNANVPFDILQTNIGSGMNIESGLFTAPSAGVYMFTAICLGSNGAGLALKLNGIDVSYSFAVENTATHGIQEVLQLNAGDKVSLYLIVGSIYDDKSSHTHFTGVQLSKMSALPNELAYFSALKNQSFGVVNSAAPFEILTTNIGGGMNRNSGYFTAPSAGVYMFTAIGLGTATVALKLNGVQVGYALADGNTATYGMQQVLVLNAGDQVSLYLVAGLIFDNETPHCHFTGIQLSKIAAPQKSLAYFYALKNQPFTTINATVPFDILQTNIGGGMDMQSGYFTAPSAGVYMFSAIGLGSQSSAFGLKLNGVYISYSFCNSATGTNGLQGVLQLNFGDQVSLCLVVGSIFDNATPHFHFTGIQLQ